MKTYTVKMENTRNGNPKTVKIEAEDRFEAMGKAEEKNKGWAAVAAIL